MSDLTTMSIHNYFLLFRWELTENALDEVAELSGVMTVGEDYLPPDVREKCERIIPNIHNVKPMHTWSSRLIIKHHQTKQLTAVTFTNS